LFFVYTIKPTFCVLFHNNDPVLGRRPNFVSVHSTEFHGELDSVLDTCAVGPEFNPVVRSDQNKGNSIGISGLSAYNHIGVTLRSKSMNWFARSE
jgi:hypothetical protein